MYLSLNFIKPSGVFIQHMSGGGVQVLPYKDDG